MKFILLALAAGVLAVDKEHSKTQIEDALSTMDKSLLRNKEREEHARAKKSMPVN